MKLPLNDSDAAFDERRHFSQHQSLLTLVQQRLDEPGLNDFRWLDIACGRGQILSQLRENIGPRGRAKIHYFAFDGSSEHVRAAVQLAKDHGVKCDSQIGLVDDFVRLYSAEPQFDLITCINAFHELSPGFLPLLLMEALVRLRPMGTIFFYDVEKVIPRELGAVPWQKAEVEELVRAVVTELGVVGYVPEPGKWRHSTVSAWNLNVQLDLLRIAREQLIAKKDDAVTAGTKAGEQIL